MISEKWKRKNWQVSQFFETSDHSYKKWNGSLGAQAEMAVLCAYVENQTKLEPILLHLGSKCKQTIENFYWPKFLLFQAISNTEWNLKLHIDHKILFSYFSRSYLHNNLGRDIQILSIKWDVWYICCVVLRLSATRRQETSAFLDDNTMKKLLANTL